MHILLIEPDTILAKLYRTSLERAGHAVTVADGAQAAVNKLNGQLPDLIVAELQLVEHNGVEFLYELRSYPEWQTIPLLVHSLVPPTALELTPLQQDRLGIIGHLYKPATSLQQLRRQVAEAGALQAA